MNRSSYTGFANMAEMPLHFLNTMFVEGLCDEVRRELKVTLPGWKTATVADVCERARQAWQTLKEEERREKKTERALIMRNLEWKSHKYDEREERPRRENPDWEPRYETGPGQRRLWNRSDNPRRQGECFRCGKPGHWGRDCNALARQRGGACDCHNSERDQLRPQKKM